MLRLNQIDKLKYDDFVKNHSSKSHFLQSLSWGEFAKAEKNLTPYYLGLETDEGKIVAAALILEKKLPLNYSYFYSPRGFVLDYNNKEVLKEMTEKTIQFIKKKKAIFLKIDPDIIKNSINYQNEEKINNKYEEIYQTLKSLGFKHQGYTKNFETMQPRYTFRIDLNQTMEEIENHFSKTTFSIMRSRNRSTLLS